MAKYTDKEMDRIISAGKKSYASMSNKGQPGGIKSIAPSARAASYSDPVEKMRGKYFDNRQDVSRDRLERRLAQQQENIFNKLTMFKPVEGTGGTLLQSRTPGGPSIADVYAASARKYGPTPSELLSDIKYGAGKMFKGLGDFVLSGGVTGKIFQTAKDLLTQPFDTAKRIGYGAQDMMKGYDPFTKQGIGETQKIETQPLPGLDLEAKMSAYEDPIKFYASSSKQKYPGYSDQQSQYYYGDKPKESPKGDQYLYADVSKRDIQTLQPIKDMGLGYDSSINMFSPVIKDLKKKNPSLTDEEIKGIIEGTITEPTGQFAEATKTTMDPYSLIRGTQETLSNLGKTRYGTFGIDNPLDVIRGGTPNLTYEKELGPGVLSGKIGDNKASLGYSMIFNKGGRVRGTGIMGALR
jgi:hypothetical protein